MKGKRKYARTICVSASSHWSYLPKLKPFMLGKSSNHADLMLTITSREMCSQSTTQVSGLKASKRRLDALADCVWGAACSISCDTADKVRRGSPRKVYSPPQLINVAIARKDECLKPKYRVGYAVVGTNISRVASTVAYEVMVEANREGCRGRHVYHVPLFVDTNTVDYISFTKGRIPENKCVRL